MLRCSNVSLINNHRSYSTGLLDRWRKFVSKENITVKDPDWNRWKAVPGAFLIQLSIGGVYSWSIFNEPLTRNVGIVAAASQDWSLGDVVPIFSCAAVSLGVCSALFGGWADRMGPRIVGMVGTACWSSGLALAAVGCHLNLLPIVYIGYSVLGGAGWGLGYISPIPALLRWFPDKRGLVSGIGLSAFGGGAILAAPLESWMLDVYFKAPNYLGKLSEDMKMITEHGKRFIVNADQTLTEVIVATQADISRLSVSVPEGVYELGTGDTGASATFLTLSAIYLVSMGTGTMLMRIPQEGWSPKGYVPLASETENLGGIHYNAAMRTPQFYLLWTTVFGNCVAGVTIISTAKTIMSDVFSGGYPLIVTGAFAASYVMALSGANMLGRLGMGPLSDKLGRKVTYGLFGLSIPLVALIPTMTAMINPASTLPLTMFVGSTLVIVSFYGAVFAVLPAYVAETFGQKHMGAIFGRVLTGLPAAALVGPSLLAFLRKQSAFKAMEDLTQKISPETFRAKFGVGVDKLEELIESKVVTIPRLMEIAPPGTPDPSIMLYDSTMYAMSASLLLAFLTNAMIRPVSTQLYDKTDKK